MTASTRHEARGLGGFPHIWQWCINDIAQRYPYHEQHALMRAAAPCIRKSEADRAHGNTSLTCHFVHVTKPLFFRDNLFVVSFCLACFHCCRVVLCVSCCYCVKVIG